VEIYLLVVSGTNILMLAEASVITRNLGII